MPCNCGGPGWTGCQAVQWLKLPASIGKVLGSSPSLATAVFPFLLHLGAYFDLRKWLINRLVQGKNFVVLIQSR